MCASSRVPLIRRSRLLAPYLLSHLLHFSPSPFWYWITIVEQCLVQHGPYPLTYEALLALFRLFRIPRF